MSIQTVVSLFAVIEQVVNFNFDFDQFKDINTQRSKIFSKKYTEVCLFLQLIKLKN